MQPSSLDIPAFLSALPLFREMCPDNLMRLAGSTELRHCERGDEICHVGQVCVGFHVVMSGQVKLFSVAPTGHEKVIELISPGQTFAEAPLFTGRPHVVNAQALTKSLILTVKKRTVLDEVERNPRLAMHMLVGISRRVDRLVQDVEASALLSGMQRVISYLLRNLSLDGVKPGQETAVSLPVAKATIASLLSLTPASFSRALRELEDGGLITVDRRRIRILDVQGLSRYRLH